MSYTGIGVMVKGLFHSCNVASVKRTGGVGGGDNMLGIADDVRWHLRYVLPQGNHVGLMRVGRISQHPDWIPRTRKQTVFSVTAVCTTTDFGKYAL